MDEREKRILEKVKADQRVEFVALLSGGRAIIKIPLNLIQVEDDAAVRGKDPKDVAILTESITNITGGDSLYSVSLLAEEPSEAEPMLRYVIGDGKQRCRAMMDAGVKETFAQVVLMWRDRRDAVEAGLSANFARYTQSDEDLFRIIRSGKLDTRQLMRATGKKESTIDRLTTCAEHEWLCSHITAGVIGYSKAAELVVACNKNGDKLAALKTRMQELVAEKQKEVDYWTNESNRTKLSKKLLAKAKLSTHFKGYDWSSLESQLSRDNAVGPDGKLAADSAPLKNRVSIGIDELWKTQIAIFNFAEREIDEIAVEDYDAVLKEWSNIEKFVRAARNRVAQNAPVSLPKLEGRKYVEETASSNDPVEQQPVSEVASENDED